MDSQKTNELYERFPHLYRERLAPLESSKMGWGFQCDDGWYDILHKMSKRIAALSSDGEFAPAITEVSRNEDGSLYVEARNLTPAVLNLIEAAKEQSKLTCESCGYAPAFKRSKDGPMKNRVACGRCVRQAEGSKWHKAPKRKRKPRRAPDVVVVKR